MTKIKLNKKRVCIAAAVLAVGFLYYIELETLGFAIPCMFYRTTGFLCPGCGVTTASVSILRGDFKRAVMANLGLAVLSPLLAVFLGTVFARWITDRPVNNKNTEKLAVLLAVLLIIWGVIRNILKI